MQVTMMRQMAIAGLCLIGGAMAASWVEAAPAGPLFVRVPVAEGWEGARGVAAADLDQDGTVDVVGAAQGGGAVGWWANRDGIGRSWEALLIDGAVPGATSVYPADLDGDGDMDVVGAAKESDALLWWENVEGTGQVWTRWDVAVGFNGAIAARTADVDGDGDLDVVGAGFLCNTLAWWENQGPGLEGGLTFLRHDVELSFAGVYSLSVADLDGDGDADLAAAARYHGALRWWENTDGLGLTWTPHAIVESFHYAGDLAAADLDLDGDVDIVGAAGISASITFFENVAGSGLEWAAHPIDGAAPGASLVGMADLDLDGDLDVIGGAKANNSLKWYGNQDGLGLDWRVAELDGALAGVSALTAADLSGDGHPDILAAGLEADGLFWYENALGIDGDGDGFSPARGDCDDDSPLSYPGAVELPYDGVDSDCDGKDPTDVDGDGVDGKGAGGSDCDDLNPAAFPGALELDDDLDNDCDGTIDEGLLTTDDDGDGFSEVQGDCDDEASSLSPGAPEKCDGIDNNCDTVIDTDAVDRYALHPDGDGDGYGLTSLPTYSCTMLEGYVFDATDCDDTKSTTYPGALELCDNRDNDCDGKVDDGATLVYYRDMDGDGYGDDAAQVQACAPPEGYVSRAGDCDDLVVEVSPAGTELCDGMDNNCDGQLDEGVLLTFYADRDGDGQAGSQESVQACQAPEGYLSEARDCDDADPKIYLGASELCGDGIDNDCQDGDAVCATDPVAEPEAGGCSCMTSPASRTPEGSLALLGAGVGLFLVRRRRKG